MPKQCEHKYEYNRQYVIFFSNIFFTLQEVPILHEFDKSVDGTSVITVKCVPERRMVSSN